MYIKFTHVAFIVVVAVVVVELCASVSLRAVRAERIVMRILRHVAVVVGVASTYASRARAFERETVVKVDGPCATDASSSFHVKQSLLCHGIVYRILMLMMAEKFCNMATHVSGVGRNSQTTDQDSKYQEVH